jgi:hypothetical protein
MNKKIASLTDNLREEKDAVYKLEAINKKNQYDYEEAMKVLREYEGTYRQLVDKRI